MEHYNSYFANDLASQQLQMLSPPPPTLSGLIAMNISQSVSRQSLSVLAPC